MPDNSSEKEEWMEWVWPGFHWYQGIHAFLAWQNDFEKFGLLITKMVLTYSRGTEAYYFLKREYEREGKEFFEKIKENPKILSGVLKNTDSSAEKIFDLEGKWKNINFRELSDKQLIKYHQSLFKLDEPLWRNGQIPNLLELGNSYLSDYVKSIISKNFGEQKFSEIFTVLTTSNYLSVGERQELDFLKLLKRFKASNSKLVDKIRIHYQKYRWMTYGWAGPEITHESFLENFKKSLKNRGSEISQLSEKFAERKSVLTEQKRFIKRFNLADRIFVNLLRQFLESKSKRIDAHSLTFFFADKIMAEIGKRVGLSMDQMRVVVPKDVPKLFKKVDVKQINEEYNRVLIWFERPTLQKLTGESAETKLKYILDRLPKIVETKELKGSVAYPGKIQGTTRVILDIKDAPRFKPGEILVTRMTDPSYVLLMKHSRAIVTDVGGITCHAAIVARELKIPCVIGTKIATKVLKDGDEVEVNANEGVVRIINKA